MPDKQPLTERLQDAVDLRSEPRDLEILCAEALAYIKALEARQQPPWKPGMYGYAQEAVIFQRDAGPRHDDAGEIALELCYHREGGRWDLSLSIGGEDLTIYDLTVGSLTSIGQQLVGAQLGLPATAEAA